MSRQFAFSILYLVAVFTILSLYVYKSSDLDIPLPPEKDRFRHLPFDHNPVFHAMGVHVFKVHVPAEQLQGMKKVEMRLTMPGKLTKIVSGPIANGRREDLPLDLTVVIQFDDLDRMKAKRVSVAIHSNEFYTRNIYGTDVWLPQVNGIGVDNAVGDIRKGIKLFEMSGYDEKNNKDLGTVSFTLWAE